MSYYAWRTATLSALLVTIAFSGASGWPNLALAEEEVPAAAESEASDTAKAAETETTAASEKDRTSRRGRLGYRTRADRLREQRNKWLDLQREQRERWQSQRRWWNNPAAEERRQWNKARSLWHRDMMSERSKLYRQQRPYYPYGRTYPNRRYYP
ncbi:MAG: hypothetical protein WBO34_04415 [Gammaproteobacteria bacterium]